MQEGYSVNNDKALHFLIRNIYTNHSVQWNEYLHKQWFFRMWNASRCWKSSVLEYNVLALVSSLPKPGRIAFALSVCTKNNYLSW